MYTEVSPESMSMRSGQALNIPSGQGNAPSLPPSRCWVELKKDREGVLEKKRGSNVIYVTKSVSTCFPTKRNGSKWAFSIEGFYQLWQITKYQIVKFSHQHWWRLYSLKHLKWWSRLSTLHYLPILEGRKIWSRRQNIVTTFMIVNCVAAIIRAVIAVR
jgi:hypothetical protein